MRILVYGDSNSWGYLADGTGDRHPRRWPLVMGEALGNGVEVVTDCLPGRTTAHDDPEMGGATFNGLAHLEASLLAHAPVDLVLIMLGTNDLKTRFAPTPALIADNLAKLVDAVTTSGAGRGPWRDGASPEVALIVPPPLGEMADSADYEREGEWTGGRAISLQLWDSVAQRCPDVPRFNASPHAEGSAHDPIHFEAESHERLGSAVADWVRETFSVVAS